MEEKITCSKSKTKRTIRRLKEDKDAKFWCENCLKMVIPLKNKS